MKEDHPVSKFIQLRVESFKNFLGEDPQTPFSLNYINSSRVKPPRNSWVLKVPNIITSPFFWKFFLLSLWNFEKKNGTFTLKIKIWLPHFWFASYGPEQSQKLTTKRCMAPHFSLLSPSSFFSILRLNVETMTDRTFIYLACTHHFNHLVSVTAGRPKFPRGHM